MSGKLDRITDWAEQAQRANWCVRTLAEQCAVSCSTLERYLRRTRGVCPHDWLVRLRMETARGKLAETSSIKQAALESGYNHPHHFSRDFKRHYGYRPSEHRVRELKL